MELFKTKSWKHFNRQLQNKTLQIIKTEKLNFVKPDDD